MDLSSRQEPEGHRRASLFGEGLASGLAGLPRGRAGQWDATDQVTGDNLALLPVLEVYLKKVLGSKGNTWAWLYKCWLFKETESRGRQRYFNCFHVLRAITVSSYNGCNNIPRAMIVRNNNGTLVPKALTVKSHNYSDTQRSLYLPEVITYLQSDYELCVDARRQCNVISITLWARMNSHSLPVSETSDNCV
jgi:hypothetical protein